MTTANEMRLFLQKVPDTIKTPYENTYRGGHSLQSLPDEHSKLEEKPRVAYKGTLLLIFLVCVVGITNQHLRPWALAGVIITAVIIASSGFLFAMLGSKRILRKDEIESHFDSFKRYVQNFAPGEDLDHIKREALSLTAISERMERLAQEIILADKEFAEACKRPEHNRREIIRLGQKAEEIDKLFTNLYEQSVAISIVYREKSEVLKSAALLIPKPKGVVS